MKALCLSEPGKLEIIDIQKPVPKEGEALIKILSMGICGSDVTSYKGINPTMKYPMILGHELFGIIEEINGQSHGFNKGDRVVVDPYIFCGNCYPCSLGRTNCCTSLKVLGTHMDGGMQEYLAHPTKLLHKVPDNIPSEIVPIVETTCIALHSTRRADVGKGDSYAIFGAGPVGLLAGMIGEMLGATTIIIDIIQDRLEKAKELGIGYTVNSMSENLAERISEITKGEMSRSVLEATGAGPAIISAMDIVSYAGKVVLTGWPKKNTELNTGLITLKELDVRGSRTANKEFKDVLRYVSEGQLDISKLLTKTCSFDNLPKIIPDIAENPGDYIKVVAMF